LAGTLFKAKKKAPQNKKASWRIFFSTANPIKKRIQESP
jgi:hypothetical protein